MCEFCKKIIYTDEEYFNARVKGGDFIYKDHNGYGILIDTGDSGCLGSLDVDYCPKCGRKLSVAGNNDCNLATCRYNKDGKCTNDEKRKECVEVANKVLYIENTESKKNPSHICETNPDCKENPSNCEYAIDCSTWEDVSNGKRRYICGLGGECNCCK